MAGTPELTPNADAHTYQCYENDCEGKFHDALNATKHLQSKHKMKDGDTLHCMTRQEAHLFCKTTFTSFKAMRKHMKDKKCKLFSRNVTDDESTESSCGGWNCLIDVFGSLGFENDPSAEIEKTKDSLATYIESFVDQLIVSNTPHDIVSDIATYTKNIMIKTTALNRELLKNDSAKETLDSILESTEKFVTSQLNKFSTRYKRKQHYTNGPYYVAPKTIPLDSEGEDTFQLVSILETLKKLFANKCFRDAYFSYNNNHICQNDIYERFCCGQNYNRSELFQLNKNSIQIQLYYDDVQLTSPLKTRPIKVCAIYFIVRNASPEFTSKLDNMYLVALCDSKLVDKYNYNSIFKHVVEDIKILETEGISIDCEENDKYNNVNLRGTLVQMSFDNLGGNTVFGYTKCFTAKYFCRICICTKKKCRKATTELRDTIRTKQQYNEQIEKIRKSGDVKLPNKMTLGIANYSVLNDLEFYHTIDNRSQDIMHDLYEGAMPIILKLLFKHLIENAVITEKEVEERIRSFNYGRLERKNIPSKICLKKKNLNQNASQMHCLMKHIPFIFVSLLQQNDNLKRTIVHKAWPIIELMLKINQITRSAVIQEENLINLEKFTQQFLEFIQVKFKGTLIPKLHFMVCEHCTSIRAIEEYTND